MFETKKKLLYFASMGFGLGLGITVSVLSPTVQVQAVPDKMHQSRYGIEIAELTFPEHSFSLDTEKSTAIKNITSGLGSGSTSIIEIQSPRFAQQLTSASLGQEVRVLGSNNGVYRFSVTRILQVERGMENALVSDTKEEVLLVVRSFPWDTKQQAIIASYQQ